MELHTKRLVLRQWREADRKPLAALNGDPQVMEFFPATMDRTQSDAFMDRKSQAIEERGWGMWAVERRGTGAFVGIVGLQPVLPQMPIGPGVEIGWRLALQHHGKGFATEAAQACMRTAFEQLELTEVVSLAACSNLPSRAVMERLRMTETKETFLNPDLPAASPLAAHCVYRLERAQWQAHQAQAPTRA